MRKITHWDALCSEFPCAVMAGEAIEDHLKERSAQLLLIIKPFKSLMACQMRVMLYLLLAGVLALQNKFLRSMHRPLIINHRPLGDWTECDLYASASQGQNVTFAYCVWQVSHPQLNLVNGLHSLIMGYKLCAQKMNIQNIKISFGAATIDFVLRSLLESKCMQHAKKFNEHLPQVMLMHIIYVDLIVGSLSYSVCLVITV